MSLRKIVSNIISIFANWVPTNRSIVFASYPDYSDNSYALYKYALKCNLNNEWKIVWITSQRERFAELKKQITNDGHNINVIFKYSLRGIWAYIRARYVFETHSLFPYIILRQHPDKHICLWHGMPLKKIGASIEGHEADSPNCNYTIAVDDKTQVFMSSAFLKPVENVLVLGQPRNDLLFEDSEYLNDIHFEKFMYRYVGIWLPTYRKSIIGDIRTDGTYEEGKISFLSIDDLYRLNNVLANKNDFLFIKLHPMDALQLFDFDDFSNIRIIKPANFKYQLYPFVGSCDYLLTDYSSVFFDFEILNKPMAFVMDDIESYSNTRGLFFDNLEDVLPGPILANLDKLFEFIESPKYEASNISLNKYKDNKSSYRMLKFLGLI